MTTLGPRLVVAGTHSGVGKTTVATGLMAALRRRAGLTVASAKVGPDFIDPGYHSLATGRPGRNLDAWLCGADAIAPLAAHAGRGADVLVVEGVMGLFDGAADDDGEPGTGSTAQVASLLGAPVLLVIDASSLSQSAGALVHGFASWDRSFRVAGVVLNRVASEGHETLLREAIEPTGIPVVGALRRDDGLAWRDRHLGLVPVVERPDEVNKALDRLVDIVSDGCDLDYIEAIARGAPPLISGDPPMAKPASDAPTTQTARIAVASGPAFSFSYPDNLELLAQAGAEVVPFDPLLDEALPDGATALIAGGGFPEVYGEALAANVALLADVRHRCAAGMVTWAECGGLLWLSRSLDGNRLAGVVPVDGHMTEKLTLGYRRATLRTASPVGNAGLELRGHEFHYSTVDPPGEALDLTSRFGTGRAGFASPTLLASYLHVHLASDPSVAEAFVAAATTRTLGR